MAVTRGLDRGGTAAAVPHPRDLATVLLYGTYVVAIVSVVTVSAVQPSAKHAFINAFMSVFNFCAVGLALRATFHQNLDRRTRTAWGFVALSYLLLVVATGFFARMGAAATFPATADWLRLAFVPALFVGLLLFPMRTHTTKDRYKLALDIGTVVAGSFMLFWYIVLGPALSAQGISFTAMAAAVAYPAGDLVLVFGATTVLMRGVASSIRRPLMILVTALGFEIVGDMYLGYMWEHRVSQDWPYLCWLTGHFLMALAAYEQVRQASGHRLDHDGATRVTAGRLPPVSLLPYLAIGLGYSLLLVHATQEGMYPWGGLASGAVVITVLVVVRQIVVLRENHELVVTDSLTGLANRVRLRESLHRSLTRAERTGRKVAVLLVDMDGFKQVNDTHGHEVGDAMLVEFGRLLTRNVHGSDTVGRLGGDEFAIVLNEIAGCEDAAAVARRIMAEMNEPLVLFDRTVQARASIGIALSGPDGTEPGELLHRADMAMYNAKRRRANSWLFYDGAQGYTVAGGGLESDLREAVSGGQLHIQYQPIVTLDTGRLAGLEALVRWEHPLLGSLGPHVFVPLAEETAVIGELGQWVLERACEEVRDWQRRLPAARALQLSVNLSPRQLEHEHLVDDILAILARTGFDPRDLVLEVTESALVDDESAVPRLRALSDSGIRIALDDFGTGYSSLRYLTRLPVDILKLDRCFVAELNRTPEGSAVAEAVVRLSQILRLDTVAEGIENAAQAAELCDLGYRTGQGFYYSKPLDPDRADALIRSQS